MCMSGAKTPDPAPPPPPPVPPAPLLPATDEADEKGSMKLGKKKLQIPLSAGGGSGLGIPT